MSRDMNNRYLWRISQLMVKLLQPLWNKSEKLRWGQTWWASLCNVNNQGNLVLWKWQVGSDFSGHRDYLRWLRRQCERLHSLRSLSIRSWKCSLYYGLIEVFVCKWRFMDRISIIISKSVSVCALTWTHPWFQAFICVNTLEWCLVKHFWVLKAIFHNGLSKVLNNVGMTRGKIISKYN